MWQPCAKYKRTPPAVRLQPPFHPSSFSTQDRIASGRIVDKKQPTRFRRRQPFVRSFPRRIAVRDLRTDSSYASVSLSAIPYRVRKCGQRRLLPDLVIFAAHFNWTNEDISESDARREEKSSCGIR